MEQQICHFAQVNKVIAIALSLLIIGSTAAQQQAKPPYLDTSRPLDQRVDDLVSRMTLEEKVSQMMNAAPAIPRLGIPEYDWWNEALHGVAFGIRDSIPASHRSGRNLGRASDAPRRRRYLDRSARQISRGATARESGPLQGLTFWSRTSISFATRVGAADRKPMAKIHTSRPARSRIRQGTAGQRSKVLESYRDAQALRRTQRTRA